MLCVVIFYYVAEPDPDIYESFSRIKICIGSRSLPLSFIVFTKIESNFFVVNWCIWSHEYLKSFFLLLIHTGLEAGSWAWGGCASGSNRKANLDPHKHVQDLQQWYFLMWKKNWTDYSLSSSVTKRKLFFSCRYPDLDPARQVITDLDSDMTIQVVSNPDPDPFSI